MSLRLPKKLTASLEVKGDEELWKAQAQKQALIRAPDEYIFRTYLY
jgi:hypothetical protein